MIYAGSAALDGLRYVVLDEVHYLQDAYRGPVWEEVIIHTPARGATWSACRPRCPTPRSWPTGSAPCGARPTAVIEERRPVELHNLYLLGDRSSRAAPPVPDPRRRPAQPRGQRPRQQDAAPPGASGAGPGGGCSRPGGPRSSSCWPTSDMLPAIYFIFSRAACDDAVAQCLRDGRAAHHARGAPPDPGHRRGARRGAVRRRPRRARLRPLAGRARGGLRRPPRRHGAAVQGGGRGVLRGRAGEGRVRHRDARRSASTCRPARSSSRSSPSSPASATSS